ncbi:MAG TPA: hypothetical protein VF810_03040 [Patescibacteria group bacterium]
MEKQLSDLERLHAIEADMRWYGWGSPIGISIFFLTLTIIAAIIKFAFFG